MTFDSILIDEEDEQVRYYVEGLKNIKKNILDDTCILKIFNNSPLA